MGNPVIFNGPYAKVLAANGIKLKDDTLVMHGSIDPTITNPSAPDGSIYLSDYGLFSRVGGAWVRLSDKVESFIKNSSFETDASGWVTYADTASSSPTDGTGGSANVTLARNTTLPLSGVASGLFTKDAVNRQGQGFSYDFTIDNASKGKVLALRFDYQIASGTYANGDLSVWVYDVTNARMIQPAPTQIQNSGIIETFLGEFQSSIDSTSYRLIVHVSSTSASAYTVKFDNFYVGRAPKIYGSVATDWELVSSGASVSWTNSNLTLYKRRVGDSVEYQGKIVFTGAPSGTNLFITLPHAIDLTKMQLSDYGDMAYLTDAGTMDYIAVGGYSASNTYNFFQISNASPLRTYNAITPTSPFSIGNTDYITFKIPPKKVLGWSSSQQLSNDADTRVVNFVGYVSSTQALTASVTNINLVAEKDSHGAWSGSTYVIPVAGDYFFTSGLTATVNQTLGVEVYVNSTFTARVGIFNSSQTSSGAVIVPSLKAGDVVSFRTSGNMTTNIGSQYKMTISRISGPSQIAASESVSARYTQSSGQSIPTSSATVVDFNTKVYDSHNAVTTGSSWRFTAPVSGEYSVVSSTLFASTAWTTNRYVAMYLRKNGVNYAATPDAVTQVAQTMYFGPYPLSAKIKLLQGEYIDVTIEHNKGSSAGMNNSSLTNWIEINRVGNY